MYQQKQYPFYNPVLVRISMGGGVTVNYVESLDQSCVEFPHVHECYEIYYCLSGEQHLFIDGTMNTLFGGHFAVIRPGVHHYTNYEPDMPKRYLVFVFASAAATALKSKGEQGEENFLNEILKYFEKNRYYVTKDRFGCDSIIYKMETEIEESYPGREQMICALYQEYLISIFRNLGPAEREKNIPSSTNLAIQITKYMHANYNKNLTIQDIADFFYISPRHVNRIFEEYFGQSLKRTLNIYRLNYAKNYLIDTTYSVEKIASLVGFSSQKTLYHLFKEMEGIPVSEYRAMHRGESNAAKYSHMEKLRSEKIK